MCTKNLLQNIYNFNVLLETKYLKKVENRSRHGRDSHQINGKQDGYPLFTRNNTIWNNNKKISLV